uniref:CLASP_N domain-containing protein n=1 Tax=Haemonchus contortus TaxID=6289 RepID=A0A7I4YHI0_HAECO
MVFWSEPDLDQITDEFLMLMLDRREFIDRWTLSVETEVARSQTRVVDSIPATPPITDVPKREDPLLSSFEELMHAVDASSQTFLSSADFTICHCEPEHNRDASLLFAARLQIDRIASRKPDSKRLGTTARRLLQLVRLFITRISSAFQISNTSAFATSLCDMLYTFCDCASHTVLSTEQNAVSELRRAVDDFNEIVVEKLSKAAFEAQCARRNAAKPARQQYFSPQPARLRRPLVQIQQRSPGYLLPPDLLKKRQKLTRARSVPSIRPPISSGAGSSAKGITSQPASQQGAVGERKTGASVKVKPVPNKSETTCDKDQNEVAIRLARKISREVIKDLRNRYGKVDIGMLGI